MRILCAPKTFAFPSAPGVLEVVLYSQPGLPVRGAAGDAIQKAIRRQKLMPAERAWDFLSLCLAIMAADAAGHRKRSPDGWTRNFELQIAVVDPAFWNSQAPTICEALAFLTTDIWRIEFISGGFLPAQLKKPSFPSENNIVLVSGGLDSFIGAADLAATGLKNLAVSHTVRGDAAKQADYAAAISGGIRHIRLNHNTKVPNGEKPPSQRARSVIFLAYGVLIATALRDYHNGKSIRLFMCENGFISVNPPLTTTRLGSLSTRTAHPVFLKTIQGVLTAAGIRVTIENPYGFKTKGEMLMESQNPALMQSLATSTTSCGRFRRYKNRHCGRCVPCLIRRAAFVRAGIIDDTGYVFEKLGIKDSDHAAWEDVRAAAMAVAKLNSKGVESIVDAALMPSIVGDLAPYKDVVSRGLKEIEVLLKSFGVQ